MVIVRSLTEQAILMRWFEPDPVLRIRIWLAEDTRLRLATAIRMEELRRRRGQPALEAFSPDEIVEMTAEVDGARSAAIAAGLRRVTIRRNHSCPRSRRCRAGTRKVGRRTRSPTEP